MRIVLFTALVGLIVTPALAQVRVEVTPPTVTFTTPPPLVDIGNGVQVVPGINQEVFFVDGYYWTWYGGHWFRTKDYLGGWVLVEDKDVAPVLLSLPRGKYKHYRPRRERGSDDEARAREERARERAEEKDAEAKAREERAQERARERAEQRDEEARAREERAQEHRERAEERERRRPDRSRTQSPRSGPEAFPGSNELSVHLGYQAGFSGKFANPSGFKLFAEYGRRLSDLVWLDVQANNVFGFGSATDTCYGPMGRPIPCGNGGFYYGGWDFELAVGVKLKIRTPIPLVVEVPLLAAVEVLYNRQCGDTGAAPALRVGGGVKYFVTRSIGVGGGFNFTGGPAFHGASDCFGSYTDFYGAFDFQVGAEFIF